MFAKIKAFFSGLFAKFSPAVQATLVQAATNIAVEVGTVGFNVLMAKAGVLTKNADVKYVGQDGSVKMNAVRAELAKFAMTQGIAAGTSALNYIIENAHASQAATSPGA